jgi:hypothetical protein
MESNRAGTCKGGMKLTAEDNTPGRVRENDPEQQDIFDIPPEFPKPVEPPPNSPLPVVFVLPKPVLFVAPKPVRKEGSRK